jgi:hypothetical protein
MQKIIATRVFNLTLLSFVCAAGVCLEAHAQGSATASRTETNDFFSGGISPPMQTTLDFDCESTSYRLSSGTTTGVCNPLPSRDAAVCEIAGTIVAHASCSNGCVLALQTGSCTRAR